MIEHWNALAVFDRRIRLTRWESGGWCADIDHAEVGEGGCLRSLDGRGSTPDAAVEALYRAITSLKPGQKIVIDAMGGTGRRDYTVVGSVVLELKP